ncbi:beta-galactosidase [Bifidobacterium scardovii]|uniref:Beta-galactosidase n=1 Tax=Bifidobacterium scardovii TaxID=158787 RepID=A0A087D7G6_9BIFI|nr:beta-galactosidase [Bifidobacterium scardovii]
MERGRLAQGHQDAGGRRHQRGHDQRVLVGAAAAQRGRVRLLHARPHRQAARRPPLRHRAGHVHRGHPRVDGPPPSGRDVHRLQRRPPQVRRSTQPLPELADLPQVRAETGRQARRAVRRHAGPGRVARLQRIRGLLLLRQLPRGVDRVAQGEVRHRRGAEQGVVLAFLGAHDLRLGRHRGAQRPERRMDARVRHAVRRRHRLPPVHEPVHHALLHRREGRDPPVRHEDADHHQSDERVHGHRLLRSGQGARRHQLGQLSALRLPGLGCGHAPRSDARRRRRQAVHAHGADAEPAELAAVQLAQAPRPDARDELSGHRARRRYRAVLPAAALHRRHRALPRRGDQPRRHREHARVPRGEPARRRTEDVRQGVHGRQRRIAGGHHVRLGELLGDVLLVRPVRAAQVRRRGPPLLRGPVPAQRAGRHDPQHHAGRPAGQVQGGARAGADHGQARRGRGGRVVCARRRPVRGHHDVGHRRRERSGVPGRLSGRVPRAGRLVGRGDRRAAARAAGQRAAGGRARGERLHRGRAHPPGLLQGARLLCQRFLRRRGRGDRQRGGRGQGLLRGHRYGRGRHGLAGRRVGARLRAGHGRDPA